MYKIAGSIFETWGHVPMLATQKKPFSFLVVRNHIIGINMLHCTIFYCFPVTTKMKIWWNEWMCFTILLFTTSLLACGEWGVGNPTIDDGHFYFLFYNILTYILCIFMPYFLGYLIKRFIENPILKVHLFIHFWPHFEKNTLGDTGLNCWPPTSLPTHSSGRYHPHQ